MLQKMICRGVAAGAFALALTLLGNGAEAATISLRDGATDATFYPAGYAGTEDSSIYYYAAPAGDTRNPNAWMRGASGGVNSFLYSANASTNYRVLLRFNLGQMATAAAGLGQQVVVTSDAVLHLRTYDAQTAARTVSLYQIASGNAGWRESVKNIANPGTPAAPTTLTSTIANEDDPTWYYMQIKNVATAPVTTSTAADTASVKWLSGQVGLSSAGSSPEGILGTGGLFNEIDLVDQNLATNDYSTPANLYANLDPIASATWATGGTAPTAQDLQFTIPAAMIQSWIDNPASNAGVLVRISAGAGQSRFYSAESTASGSTWRPTLDISYNLVPEPATIGLVVIGAAALVVRRRR